MAAGGRTVAFLRGGRRSGLDSVSRVVVRVPRGSLAPRRGLLGGSVRRYVRRTVQRLPRGAEVICYVTGRSRVDCGRVDRTLSVSREAIGARVAATVHELARGLRGCFEWVQPAVVEGLSGWGVVAGGKELCTPLSNCCGVVLSGVYSVSTGSSSMGSGYSGTFELSTG